MIHPILDWNYNGWEFGNKVSMFVIHSGMDYNRGSGHTDFGDHVMAITDMEIIWVKDTLSTGWGRVIIGYSRRYDRYFRYAHLKNIIVHEGQTIKEGEIIAKLGGSGHGGEKYYWSHLHLDVIKKKLPTNWLKYTKYWSMKKVNEYYEDPLEFIKEKNDLEELDRKPEEPKIIQWYKKTGVRMGWDVNPSEIDVNNAYALYKGLYLIASPAKRKKYLTLQDVNDQMNESINNFNK